MYLEIQQRLREKFVQAVEQVYGIKIDLPVLGFPPNVDLGEISITGCFELAKTLRQPPRKIAEQIAPRLLPVEGIERASIAGPGYVNLHLDRAALASDLFRTRAFAGMATPEPSPSRIDRKVLVEHTSINPNKAAHIGHLRNAVLGDTFVRLLRFRGGNVEVENYIDNTGVQVADVVVGFVHLEKRTTEDVRKLIADPAVRFDYYCWDLYARVFQYYETNPEALALRSEALKHIEDGHGELACMAELISTAIVRAHLETMWRINVRYDLLCQESEILRLDFWKSAFELMKQRGAVRYETAGKNAGCWVMDLAETATEAPGPDAAVEDVKIIVRSNGTVTYVGKDIAYHLWKFGLLGRDFEYERFYRCADGKLLWRTAVHGQPDAPAFGHATSAYAVIDTRQSYLQNVVAASFRALGYHEQAANLHHFAYEVVGLTPNCAREMGIELGDDIRQRSYVEVSGRKGLGIKADDLLDALVNKAAEEVRSRKMTQDPGEQESYARMIAVSALRYFLLKYTRRSIIAFDLKEALAFEGETGPYLQYTVVRARNIFRKFQESHGGFAPEQLDQAVSPAQLKQFFAASDRRDFWELALVSAQLEMAADQAIAAEEPAVIAKYAFRLAQAFNNFYHHYHILSEPDEDRQKLLLYLVYVVSQTLAGALDLLGIQIPERM